MCVRVCVRAYVLTCVCACHIDAPMDALRNAELLEATYTAYILLLDGFGVLDLTRFNKIATQGTPQMAVDKEAICLSRVYSYYPKCNLPLFYV